MITKGVDTNFRWVGLVEVLWKSISGIIDCQLSSSIQFHNSLCGFCAGRGTRTAILGAKLFQQLIYMRDTVLRAIFLNLRKSYDALDRYRCLDILVGYEVEPRTLCILQIKWVCLQVVAKSGGGYRNVLQSHCKVTQGVPLSPMIFNVVVNSFIRHWVTVVGGAKEDAGQEVLGTSIQALSALFYAGYGPIAPPESARLRGGV